jgi:DNA invertase Pin-like site-specific DNA recombinase
MMAGVRQRHYDLVLVWRLDRFSRETMNNTLGYINELKAYKTGLKSLNEPWLDTTQPQVAELLLAIMAWVASEERRKISENTKAALAKLKARGVKLGRPWHKEKGINKGQPLKEHDFVLDPGLPKGYL